MDLALRSLSAATAPLRAEPSRAEPLECLESEFVLLVSYSIHQYSSLLSPVRSPSRPSLCTLSLLLLNCICLLVLIHHRAGPNTGTRQATECVTRLRVGTQRDPRKARRSEERSIGALNLNRTFRPLECTVIVLSLLISSVFSAVLCSSECPPPRRPAPLIAATRVVSCDRVTSWRGVRCDSDHFWVDSLSRLPLPLLCSAGASSVNKNEVK